MKKRLILTFIISTFFVSTSFVSAYGGGSIIGGGGSSGTKINKKTPTSQPLNQEQIDSMREQVVQVQDMLGSGTAQGQVLGASNFIFKTDLTLGTTMSDIKELQKLLRAEGFFTYPEDTGYFGQATREAVMAFQRARGISPVSGFVGPLTRAELNKGTVAPVATTEADDEVSVETFIELLIGLGVIPADKAEQARTLAKDEGESA